MNQLSLYDIFPEAAQGPTPAVNPTPRAATPGSNLTSKPGNLSAVNIIATGFIIVAALLILNQMWMDWEERDKVV